MVVWGGLTNTCFSVYIFIIFFFPLAALWTDYIHMLPPVRELLWYIYDELEI